MLLFFGSIPIAQARDLSSWLVFFFVTVEAEVVECVMVVAVVVAVVVVVVLVVMVVASVVVGVAVVVAVVETIEF